MAIMKRLIALVSVFLSVSVFAETFPESRNYQRLVGDFKTVEECEQYKRDTGSWFNCFQQIGFEPDGSATVVLTDIMNLASYRIVEGQRIEVESARTGDMPDQMEFLQMKDSEIIQLPEGLVWHRILKELKRSEDCFQRPTGRFRTGGLCTVDTIECHETIEFVCIDERGKRRVRDSWEQFSHCTSLFGNGYADCRQR